MTVLENIINTLNSHKMEYERVEHIPVFTSEEAAQIRNSDLSMGVKALILMADKSPILIAIPGDKRLSFKKAKDSIGIKDLRMASKEEIRALTGLEVGSIPPLGNLMNIPTHFDTSIFTKDKVAFNAGSHTVSVIMRAKDLIDLVRPVQGDYIQ